MSYSFTRYVSDGVTTTYAIPFKYLDISHVKVTVNGVSVPFTLINSGILNLGGAVPSGKVIQITRNTPLDAPLVDFVDGSVLTEKDLDTANNQLFNIAQEAWDKSELVLTEAEAIVTSAGETKVYANLAYQYERLANDHMENAEDAADRAAISRDLSGEYLTTLKTLATEVENDRSSVAADKDIILSAKEEVNVASHLVTSQASLATSVLTQAQQAASEANTISSAALSTAQEVQTLATSLNSTITTVAAQQDAALAAKSGAEAAATVATTAKDDVVAAKAVVDTKAAEVATNAATVASSLTTINAAVTATNADKIAAAASATQAAASAASIDVSSFATKTYVDTQDSGKAAIDHLHTGTYQPVGDYAVATHNHDAAYAALSHNHDGTYATAAQGTKADTAVQSSAGTASGLTLNDGYTEEVYSLTGTAISPANGSIQYCTLTANTTFTEALADGQSVMLMLNPATYTVTWPTITWIGSAASTAPTLVASVYNCITLFQIAGVVYGKYVGRV